MVAALGYLAHGWLGDRFDRHKVIAFGWLIGAVLSAATGLGLSYSVAALVVGAGACLLSGLIMFGARAIGPAAPVTPTTETEQEPFAPATV